MAKAVVTPIQQSALELIGKSSLADNFYFTGGTALSLYYLQHRISEDLDFFSEAEFSPFSVSTELKGFKNKLGYTSIDIGTSFNRNIYLLRFKHKKFLKLEFTYFPFPQIEKPKIINDLKVDSLIDIGVNKLFTIAQNPRGKDYFDLYFIVQKKRWSLDKLRKLAKQKFDWHVDPLQLGSQLFRVDDFLDDPIIIKHRSQKKITSFFKSESKKLKKLLLK